MTQNKSGIIPVGFSVLVLPDIAAQKTESGIIIETDSNLERVQMAQTDGLVIAISEYAFGDEKLPRCDVGDRIIFARHTGMIRKGNDGIDYRIIRDIDVVAILKEDK